MQTSGTVGFTISPNNSGDDYDWAVYDLTNHECMDIASQADLLQVSCNFCGTSGDTGPNGSSSDVCQHGNSCTPFNAMLNVVAGETYVINVSNFSATQSGYSIVFNGSAQIVDDTGPVMEEVVYNPICGASSLTILLSEGITCQSVQPSDFVITGPEGNYEIDAVWSEMCQAGLGSSYGDTYYDDVWTLELSDYLQDDGSYTIELVNGGVDDICNNSSASSSLNFTINGVQAQASVINGVTCFGDDDGSATVSSVTGGSTPYTYAWSSGETSETAAQLEGGEQYVTVTDSTGICVDIVPVDIPEPPEVEADAGEDALICPGGSYVLGGSPTAVVGVAPFTYEWQPTDGLDDPTASNPTASPDGTNTYVVTVTDANACTGSDDVEVSLNPAINIDFEVTDALCNGSATGGVVVHASGGLPPFTFAWSDGLGNDSTVSTGMMAGTDYYVTVTDDHGCQEVGTVSVGEPPPITVDYDIIEVECGVNDGAITATASGGSAPYTYQIDTVSGNTITNLSPGNYGITVTDANDCEFTDIVEVGFYGENQVVIVQTEDILCYGESTADLSGFMIDGVPPYDFQWSIGSASDSTLIDVPAGDYGLTITDEFGCPGSAEYTVTQPTLLELYISSQNVLCTGEGSGSASIDVIGATPPYSYLWTNDETTPDITGLEPGTYGVTVTDFNGCSATESTLITEPPEALEIFVQYSNVDCHGNATGSALATADGGTPPIEFVWYEGSNAIANGAFLMSLDADNYMVQAIDSNDCTTSVPFTISEPSPLLVNYSVQQATCIGNNDGQVAVSATGGTQPYIYEWSLGVNTASVSELFSGNYSVTVTDANNCREIMTLYVPENDELCLNIPNAFSPNGDGINDKWIVDYIERYPKAHIQVFNRWGQEVYDAHVGDPGWDGTYNGKKCATGSYVFVVDLHNGFDPYTGVLVLVR